MMPHKSFRYAVQCVFAAVVFGFPAATRAQDTGLFRVTTDEFWLNLHHFLYVLGRAQGHARDASREAVANAPREMERGLATLNDAERTVWKEAVAAYMNGASTRDVVFDRELAILAGRLAGLEDDAVLPALADTSIAHMLRRAAPVYRKAWWPAHRRANRAWAASMQPLLAGYGASIRSFVERAYSLRWPSTGYAVRVAAFSNWAGAYSTDNGLLVISSETSGTAGFYGLEILFHEAMHQWDRNIMAAIGAAERSQRVKSTAGLSHMMIFYTAGEAVRSVVPSHIPYAEQFGIWARGQATMKTVLDQVWKPYLEGDGRRDDAIARMVRALAAP